MGRSWHTRYGKWHIQRRSLCLSPFVTTVGSSGSGISGQEVELPRRQLPIFQSSWRPQTQAPPFPSHSSDVCVLRHQKASSVYLHPQIIHQSLVILPFLLSVLHAPFSSSATSVPAQIPVIASLVGCSNLLISSQDAGLSPPCACGQTKSFQKQCSVDPMNLC